MNEKHQLRRIWGVFFLISALAAFGTSTATAQDGGFFIVVSERAIRDLLPRTVEIKSPVRENGILGAEAEGSARTRGTVNVDFVPSHQHAVIRLSFSGEVVADTVAANGPVRATTRTLGRFTAEKIVWLDSSGFTTKPTRVESDTAVSLRDVGSGLSGFKRHIVRQVALRKIGMEQEELEKVADERVEAGIGRAIDAAVDTALQIVNRGVLLRRAAVSGQSDGPPGHFCYATTAESLVVANGPRAGQGTVTAREQEMVARLADNSLLSVVMPSAAWRPYQRALELARLMRWADGLRRRGSELVEAGKQPPSSAAVADGPSGRAILIETRTDGQWSALALLPAAATTGQFDQTAMSTVRSVAR